MRIRMLVGLSGPTYTLDPGDEYECADAEAIRLIAADFAVPADGDDIERAVMPRPLETRKRGRPRKAR